MLALVVYLFDRKTLLKICVGMFFGSMALRIGFLLIDRLFRDPASRRVGWMARRLAYDGTDHAWGRGIAITHQTSAAIRSTDPQRRAFPRLVIGICLDITRGLV